MYQLVKLPQAPVISAPPEEKRPRMRNLKGEDEFDEIGRLDNDYDDTSASTVFATMLKKETANYYSAIKAKPKRTKRGPYKRAKAKVARGGDAFGGSD